MIMLRMTKEIKIKIKCEIQLDKNSFTIREFRIIIQKQFSFVIQTMSFVLLLQINYNKLGNCNYCLCNLSKLLPFLPLVFNYYLIVK